MSGVVDGLGVSVLPAQRLSGPEPLGRCGEGECPAPASRWAYRVKWQVESTMWVRRFGRLPRVVRLSCPCRPVEYELLAIGGLHSIRRTDRTGDGLVVRVSPEAANSRVGEWWSLIMSGDAR
jgi:hypothetical protein